MGIELYIVIWLYCNIGLTFELATGFSNNERSCSLSGKASTSMLCSDYAVLACSAQNECVLFRPTLFVFLQQNAEKRERVKFLAHQSIFYLAAIKFDLALKLARTVRSSANRFWRELAPQTGLRRCEVDRLSMGSV